MQRAPLNAYRLTGPEGSKTSISLVKITRDVMHRTQSHNVIRVICAFYYDFIYIKFISQQNFLMWKNKASYHLIFKIR